MLLIENQLKRRGYFFQAEVGVTLLLVSMSKVIYSKKKKVKNVTFTFVTVDAENIACQKQDKDICC